MGNVLATGNVFRMGAGFVGIISYFPETVVTVYQTETESLFSICEELARRFAGKFVVADSQTEKWGRVVFKAQGSAILLPV